MLTSSYAYVLTRHSCNVGHLELQPLHREAIPRRPQRARRPRRRVGPETVLEPRAQARRAGGHRHCRRWYAACTVPDEYGGKSAVCFSVFISCPSF